MTRPTARTAANPLPTSATSHADQRDDPEDLGAYLGFVSIHYLRQGVEHLDQLESHAESGDPDGERPAHDALPDTPGQCKDGGRQQQSAEENARSQDGEVVPGPLLASPLPVLGNLDRRKPNFRPDLPGCRCAPGHALLQSPRGFRPWLPM